MRAAVLYRRFIEWCRQPSACRTLPIARLSTALTAPDVERTGTGSTTAGMVAPGVKRVIDIDVTNRCSIMKCSNCTRGLVYQQKRWDMTPENFRRAVQSLRDWTEQPPVRGRMVCGPRIVAIIGGNPCMSPHFEAYCRILREEIPRKTARGLWTENLNGHGALARETFGYFNLNVHGSVAAVREMDRYLPGADVLGAPPYRAQSVHGAIFTAIRDFVGSTEIPDDEAMWDRIRNCDVNVNWSGSIMPFDMPDGTQEIRAYFCEIAAVLERINASRDEAEGLPVWGPVHGALVERGWWRKTMDDPAFHAQHREWCPRCGVPLRIKGHEDVAFTDDLSRTHDRLIQVAVKRRQKIEIHETPPALRAIELTDYQRIRTPDEVAMSRTEGNP